jgi:hypothetical protein
VVSNTLLQSKLWERNLGDEEKDTDDNILGDEDMEI